MFTTTGQLCHGVQRDLGIDKAQALLVHLVGDLTYGGAVIGDLIREPPFQTRQERKWTSEAPASESDDNSDSESRASADRTVRPASSSPRHLPQAEREELANAFRLGGS